MKRNRMTTLAAASSVAALLALSAPVAVAQDRASSAGTPSLQTHSDTVQRNSAANNVEPGRTGGAATAESTASERDSERRDAGTSSMGAGARSDSEAATRGEPQESRRSLGEFANDAVITGKVKTGLARDEDLSAMRIDVDTREGVVTLSGSAPSEEAKRRAEQIARTSGEDVREVRNELRIEPRQQAEGERDATRSMGAGSETRATEGRSESRPGDTGTSRD